MKTTVIQHTFEIGALVKKKGGAWLYAYEIEAIDLKKNGEITYRLKDMDITWAEDELELAFPAFPIGAKVKVKGDRAPHTVKEVEYNENQKMYMYKLEKSDTVWVLEVNLEEVKEECIPAYYVAIIGTTMTKYAEHLTREEAKHLQEKAMVEFMINLMSTPYLEEIRCSYISYTVWYRKKGETDTHWVEFTIEQE